MTTVVYIAISFAVGVLIGMLANKKAVNVATGKFIPNQKQEQQKTDHLNTILNEVVVRGQINNAQVEAMLRVSAATAERYLDELEHAGNLVQVGKTGRSVIYKNANSREINTSS